MSVNKNNCAMAANSSKWAMVLAAWKFLVEYTADYLSGNKYKPLADLKQAKQK